MKFVRVQKETKEVPLGFINLEDVREINIDSDSEDLTVSVKFKGLEEDTDYSIDIEDLTILRALLLNSDLSVNYGNDVLNNEN